MEEKELFANVHSCKGIRKTLISATLFYCKAEHRTQCWHHLGIDHVIAGTVFLNFATNVFDIRSWSLSPIKNLPNKILICVGECE